MVSLLQLCLAAFLTNAACMGQETAARDRREPTPFDYDTKRPLEATAKEERRDDKSTTYKIRFSGKREIVPGLLTVPSGVSRPPVVLILHGLGGSKQMSQLFSPAFVSEGYAVLALDAPGHGERAGSAPSSESSLEPDVSKMHAQWVEAIVDYRRGIDYLESRGDVDTKRIVLLGVSMGGMMGSLLAGSDKRIDAAALVVAGGNWRNLVTDTNLSQLKPLKSLFGEKGLPEDKKKLVDEIDPATWVAKISPRPVLLLNGTKDNIVPKSASDALISAAKEPKTVIIYEGGHLPPAPEVQKVFLWLVENTPAKS